MSEDVSWAEISLATSEMHGLESRLDAGNSVACFQGVFFAGVFLLYLAVHLLKINENSAHY